MPGYCYATANRTENWLQTVYPERDFDLSFAAADADFRRYFRAAFSDGGSVVCMDAPPDKMSVAPYLKVQKLFDMVNVPQVLHADTDLGFVVLNDLGNTTFLTAMLQEQGEAAHKALLLEAIGELVGLQKASREGVLPEYDRETMLREINLFPEWFVAKELGRELTFKQRQLWQQTADTLLPPLLAQPKVYVHRDFIVRNLMLTRGRPGVLDFKTRFTTDFLRFGVAVARCLYRVGRRVCFGFGYPLLGKGAGCLLACPCRV